MEFEVEGVVFSNEYMPPNIKKFPHIDGYAQFLVNYQKIKNKVWYVVVERKYDGTNIRLVNWGDKVYVLTRKQAAENRFMNLLYEAFKNNPHLITHVKQFRRHWGDGSYLVGELVSGKIKAPYTSQFQASNLIIFEYWDNSIGHFAPWRITSYYDPAVPEFRLRFMPDEINKAFMRQLSETAWLRDYEGFVVKAIDDYNHIILRGKVKPVHFNYPTHEGQLYAKSKKKEGKKGKGNVASEEEVLEAIHKVKLRLSPEEFINPKIAMPAIAVEVKEEYGKDLPRAAYRLYLSVVEAEL